MSRTPRLLAVATLAALWIATAPAAAAPAAGWSLFATFSPFDWIRHLWAEEGTDINPWGRTAPAGGGAAASGAPRGLWAEEGTEINPWGRTAPAAGGAAASGALRGLWAEEGASINPWGQPAPVLHSTGAEMSPWGQQ